MASSPITWPENEHHVSRDRDKELFERARNAADKAVREGNAQLKAAMAAGGVPQWSSGMSLTRMRPLSLAFECSRLELAYQQRSSTSIDLYDYISVIFVIAACAPQLCKVTLQRGGTNGIEKTLSLAGLFFCDLWAMWAAISCLAVIFVQQIFPRWFTINRGVTLKYLGTLLWIWGSVKLYVDNDALIYTLTEVVVMNISMTFLHRATFMSQLQCRGFCCGIQLVAIASRDWGADQTLYLAVLLAVTNLIGLLLSYVHDRAMRREYLKSTAVWMYEDAMVSPAQPRCFLSYRASLSRQLWNLFHGELRGSKYPVSVRTSTYEQIMAPRRALGGFAGGFGGVSGLKCSPPLSNSPSPVSSSCSLSGRTSDSSTCNWVESGLSSGEVVSNGLNFGPQHKERPCWSEDVTTSDCSYIGIEGTPLHLRRRQEAFMYRDHHD